MANMNCKLAAQCIDYLKHSFILPKLFLNYAHVFVKFGIKS